MLILFNAASNIFISSSLPTKIPSVVSFSGLYFVSGRTRQTLTGLSKPLILMRKKGKLPSEKYSQDFELEYGKATLEMHKDSIKPGEKILIIDDLIATGGTSEAGAKLVEKSGGIVWTCVFR